MKRVLVDGTNLAHIHWASNPSLDGNGNPAGIIKGFIAAVKHINKLYSPDQIIVFWDGPGGSLQRRQLYKEYKEGRKPRTIVGQFYKFSNEQEAQRNYDWQTSCVKKLLSHCGICSIITDNYEADDGIAYIINSNPNDEHIIVSCDKDFCQLLNEKVYIYNPIMKELLGAKWLLEKFEIHPENWLFYRALNGDLSDNINGVKGFGPKTIKKIFALQKKEKIDIVDISEGVKILSEEKRTGKEKTLLQKLQFLESNLDLIKRNLQLMDLRNPLMALVHKKKIEYQLENFHPALNYTEFYAEIMKLNIGINTMTPNEFVRLKNK